MRLRAVGLCLWAFGCAPLVGRAEREDGGFVLDATDGARVLDATGADGRTNVADGATSDRATPTNDAVVACERSLGAAPPGTADRSLALEWAAPSGAAMGVRGGLIDASGRIYLYGTGRCGPSNTMDGWVARLLRNGTPDSTFGSGGMLCVRHPNPSANDNETFYGGAFAPDGGLWLVGEAYPSSSVSEGLVARVTEDGRLDNRFASGGVRVLAERASVLTAPRMTFYDVVVEPDRIVVVGSDANPFTPNTLGYVFAMDLNGDLDPGFNDGQIQFDGSVEGFFAIKRAGDGYLLLGDDRLGVRPLVKRLSHQGQLDTAYGQNGIARIPGDTAAVGRSMLLQEDGSVLVAGGTLTATAATYGFLAKLTPDGRVDPGFASLGAGFPLRWDVGFQFGSTLAQGCGGSIYVAGQEVSSAGPMLLSRFRSDGRLDITFARSGTLRLPPPSGQIRGAGAVLLDPTDQSVVMVAQSGTSTSVGLYRFAQ